MYFLGVVQIFEGDDSLLSLILRDQLSAQNPRQKPTGQRRGHDLTVWPCDKDIGDGAFANLAPFIEKQEFIYAAGQIDFIKPLDGRTPRELQPKPKAKDEQER